MSKIKVSFREELGLTHNIGGLVGKVVSPKARRQISETKNGIVLYHYELKTESISTDPEATVDEGLYEVLDICRWNGPEGKLQWNVYLILVTKDECIPVAEYLDNPNTDWVKEAKSLVKAFFDGEELERVELTPQPKPKEVRWGSNYNKPEREPAKKVEDNFINKPETEDEGINKPLENKKSTKETTASIEYGYAIVYRKNGNKLKTAKILRHSAKYVEIELDKKPTRYFKETGECVEGSTHIEFNLDKEEQ